MTSKTKVAVDAAEEADDLFKMFGTSEKEAEDGKWFKIGKWAEVKVRRFSAKRSQEIRSELEAPYRKVVQVGGRIPAEAMEEITNIHIATGILVDWKGIKSRDGEIVPYNKANAIEMFKLLPDFKAVIASLALDIENFKVEEKKELEGN